LRAGPHCVYFSARTWWVAPDARMSVARAVSMLSHICQRNLVGAREPPSLESGYKYLALAA